MPSGRLQVIALRKFGGLLQPANVEKIVKKSFLPILCVCGLSLLIAGGAFAKEQTPPGSFLKYRATTVSELTSQVSKDTQVNLRYAQHFGVSADRVAAYFKYNLKLVTLKSPCKVQSWYVNKDGKRICKTKLLPKGTLVFADKSGAPLLAWSCGNPLRASLPHNTVAKAKEPVTATAGMTEEVGLAAEPETLVLANPIETVAAAAVTAPPGFIAQTLPALATAQQIAAAPIFGAAALPSIAAIPVAAGGGIGALGWIGGLAGLGGAVALAGGGGGNDPQPPAVPEPAGLLTIMVGLSSFAPAVTRMMRRK